MGYGGYSYDSHVALSARRAGKPAQEVFTQTACHALMNPKGVKVRECRDSEDHPNSIGIAFALDVTGSMGNIPKLLAQRDLPHFMKILTDCGIADPQLLFLAVGDATCDGAPLQVGQFESTAALMDQWLTWSYLEGGGGAGITESYELALYFLARHTALDCWLARKQRGYVFMTGDELAYPYVSRHQVESLIGDRLDEDLTTASVVAALQETFEPFFLIPDAGRAARCEDFWRELLGDHVVVLETADDTCFAAAALMALGQRVVRDIDQLATVLRAAGLAPDRVGAVLRAVTPYAATLDADGVREPPLDPVTLPGTGRSRVERL